MTTAKIHVAKTLDCLVETFVERLDHDALLAYCREYEVETSFDTTLDDNWPDYTNEVVVELAAAMVESYGKESRAIHHEICDVIKRLGGKSDILATVCSRYDTLNDSDVLCFLQDWNNNVKHECICSVDEAPYL